MTTNASLKESGSEASPQYSLANPVVSWKEHFRDGIIAFRAGNYENAVECFDEVCLDYSRYGILQLDHVCAQAIAKRGESFQLYDSRAAALEKLGRIKQALRDSRKTIDLAPEKCHVGDFKLRSATSH